MDVVAAVVKAGHPIRAENIRHFDIGFLPHGLIARCRRLIESYHDLHGDVHLPDVLWKAGLGPLIETHREFRQLLRQASTSRSAKRSNDGFVRIATTILSLEILASRFAGWSAIDPDAAAMAQDILRRNAGSLHMPLMDFYLYPPKNSGSAAVAAPAPPSSGQTGDVEPTGSTPAPAVAHAIFPPPDAAASAGAHPA